MSTLAIRPPAPNAEATNAPTLPDGMRRVPVPAAVARSVAARVDAHNRTARDLRLVVTTALEMAGAENVELAGVEADGAEPCLIVIDCAPLSL